MKTIKDLIFFFFMGYIDFDDRCDRRRFWLITPVYVLCLVGVTLLSVRFTGAPRQIIFWGFLVSTLVPFISLIVKRLHDFNITGYAVIALVPILFVGGIWVCLLAIIAIGFIPATRGTNKYGDDARGGNVSVFD